MQCNGGRVGRSHHVYNVNNWEALEWHKRKKPAFTPPGHIKRQQRKSKEALFCKIFNFFLYRFALGALQNFLADGFLYARFSGR